VQVPVLVQAQPVAMEQLLRSLPWILLLEEMACAKLTESHSKSQSMKGLAKLQTLAWAPLAMTPKLSPKALLQAFAALAVKLGNPPCPKTQWMLWMCRGQRAHQEQPTGLQLQALLRPPNLSIALDFG